MPSKFLRVKSATVAGLALLSIGGVAAAATGLAPAAAERAAAPERSAPDIPGKGAHARGEAATVTLPDGAGAAATGKGPSSGKPADHAAGPDASGPARQGLCQAWLAGQGDVQGRRADAPAFQALAAAAGAPTRSPPTARPSPTQRPSGSSGRERPHHKRAARGPRPGTRQGRPADDHLTRTVQQGPGSGGLAAPRGHGDEHVARCHPPVMQALRTREDLRLAEVLALVHTPANHICDQLTDARQPALPSGARSSAAAPPCGSPTGPSTWRVPTGLAPAPGPVRAPSLGPGRQRDGGVPMAGGRWTDRPQGYDVPAGAGGTRSSPGSRRWPT